MSIDLLKNHENLHFLEDCKCFISFQDKMGRKKIKEINFELQEVHFEIKKINFNVVFEINFKFYRKIL